MLLDNRAISDGTSNRPSETDTDELRSQQASRISCARDSIATETAAAAGRKMTARGRRGDGRSGGRHTLVRLFDVWIRESRPK